MKKGIMFDMDNTILRSNINLTGMREDLIRFLKEHGYGHQADFQELHTASQVVEYGKQYAHLKPELRLEEAMWSIVKEHERIGMEGALLEEGAMELISELKSKGILLTIVTNNAEDSTTFALSQTDLLSYFDLIITRDQMTAMKPSPSGVHVVLEQFDAEVEWIFVGDSWIDGRAALEGNVPFIAYQSDAEALRQHNVVPLASIEHLADLAPCIEEYWRSKV